MRENLFESNAVTLNYMEYPNRNPPILLLHGATSRWQSFLPVIPELTHHFHVYALDFRGHGQSQRMGGAYTLSDYLNDVYVFINECIKEPVIIMGHSLGGMIGIMLAAKHPELVKNLIMIDTPLTLKPLHRLASAQVEQANLLIQSLRFSHFFPGLPMPEGLRQCDPEMLFAMINQFDKTFDQYKEHELFPKITCPALLIRGGLEHGSLVTDSDLDGALKLLPDLAHVHLPHVGHSPIRQDNEAVLNVLEGFLNYKKEMKTEK